jgi:hypothetical protein
MTTLRKTTIGVDDDVISAAKFIAKDRGLAPSKHFASVARMAILGLAKQLGWMPSTRPHLKK